MTDIVVALISNPYLLGFLGGVLTTLYAPKAAMKLWGWVRSKFDFA